jgi:hypothetical protein
MDPLFLSLSVLLDVVRKYEQVKKFDSYQQAKCHSGSWKTAV